MIVIAIILLALAYVPNRAAGRRRLGWLTRLEPWDGVVLGVGLPVLWVLLYVVGAVLLIWVRHDYTAWEAAPFMAVRIGALLGLPLGVTARVRLRKRHERPSSTECR
jgi:hypothetical protein